VPARPALQRISARFPTPFCLAPTGPAAMTAGASGAGVRNLGRTLRRRAALRKRRAIPPRSRTPHPAIRRFPAR
jgi:hypothetical protein